MEPQARTITETPLDHLGLAVIGGLMAAGLWGAGRQILSPAALAGMGLALAPALIPSRRRGISLGVAAAGWAALVLLALLRTEQLVQGLGAMTNELAATRTARTGYYFPRFETAGGTWEANLAVGALIGALLALVLRARTPLLSVGLLGGVLVLCGFGLLEAGGWLGLFLTGAVLKLVYAASGGRAVPPAASVLLLAGLLGLFALGDFLPQQTDSGKALEKALHQWTYGEDPLPEGDIAGAGAFTPGGDAALEVTMDVWEPVYLRGFVGASYENGQWQPCGPAAAAAESDLLYTLQKSYFFPEMQLSAANLALESQSENRIRVTNLGACRAYAYLPYGIGGAELDPRALTGQRAQTVSGTLYPVGESYLVQQTLSEGQGAQSYRDGEAAYREWVYAQYLDVPDAAAALLEEAFEVPTEPLTTSQARELVLQWLDEALVYDLYASARRDGADYLDDLLNVTRRGYSIHYATLGTLMLRKLGIPARYAEGYLITRDMANAGISGEPMTVTQENAHAWVEFYLDGVGWIPFEVTPGYENQITYLLPSDGTGEKPDEPEPDDQQAEPPVEQQTDPGSRTNVRFVRVVRNVVLAVIAAFLLALVLRTVLLRRRLRQRLNRFRREESREAVLDCLRYQQELLESMGHDGANLPLMEQEAAISGLLGGMEVHRLLLLAQEAAFSDHAVTAEAHQLALEYCGRIQEIWKTKTPALGRFIQKWVKCTVL